MSFVAMQLQFIFMLVKALTSLVVCVASQCVSVHEDTFWGNTFSLMGKHTQPHYSLNLQMGIAAVWLCWTGARRNSSVPMATRFSSNGPGSKNTHDNEANIIQHHCHTKTVNVFLPRKYIMCLYNNPNLILPKISSHSSLFSCQKHLMPFILSSSTIVIFVLSLLQRWTELRLGISSCHNTQHAASNLQTCHRSCGVKNTKFHV